MKTESERKRLKFLLLGSATALEEGGINSDWGAFRYANDISPAELPDLIKAMAYAIRYFVADAMADESD